MNEKFFRLNQRSKDKSKQDFYDTNTFLFDRNFVIPQIRNNMQT